MTPFDASTPDTPAASQRGVWTTFFLDTSNNNGAVDWREVARGARHTGITASALKATEGGAFRDSLFVGARAECAHFGIRVMPYHFARPDQHPGPMGAIQEAEHFCNVVGAIHPWEWRPMLDFETPPFTAEWVVAWNEHVHTRLGVWPILYSYWSALVGMNLKRPLGAGLNLAYPNGLPRVAPAPRPWKRWTAHQYAWHGHVGGVHGDVDLNWTPAVRALLANPIRGAAYEPVFAARRRKA